MQICSITDMLLFTIDKKNSTQHRVTRVSLNVRERQKDSTAPRTTLFSREREKELP